MDVKMAGGGAAETCDVALLLDSFHLVQLPRYHMAVTQIYKSLYVDIR